MDNAFKRGIFLCLLILVTIGVSNSFAETVKKLNSKEAAKLAADMAKAKKTQREMEKNMVDFFCKEGQAFFKKGDYSSALNDFSKALEIDPSNQSAKSYIDKCRKKIDADKLAKISQGTDEARISAYMRQGKIFYGEGKYDKALESFGNVLVLDPENKAASDWVMKTKRLNLIKDANQEEKDYKKDLKISLLEKENIENKRMLEVERGYLPPDKPLKRKMEIEEVANDAETKEEESRRKLLEDLQKKIVPAVSLADADIRDVIRQLMDMTGVTIVIDEKSLAEINQGAGLKLTFSTVSSMPLLDLLNIALKTSGLSYRVEPTYVWISTPARLQEENLVTKTYKLKYGVRRIRKVELEKIETLKGTAQ